jgi:lysophospholipase-2
MEDRQVNFSIWKELAEILAGQLEMPFISPDPAVKMTREELEENGILGLHFYSYEDLPHWFNQEELEDLAIWISVLVENNDCTLI